MTTHPCTRTHPSRNEGIGVYGNCGVEMMGEVSNRKNDVQADHYSSIRMKESINESIDRSITQPTNSPINRSIDQSSNRSINAGS
jgi:hypothetical protein